MSDDDRVLEISDAPSLSKEEIARRRAFAEQQRRDAATMRRLEGKRPKAELLVEDWMTLGEGLLYTTRMSCQEYLAEVPPELQGAIAALERAMLARDPALLSDAIHRLEAMTHEVFFPDDPGGGSPAAVALAKRRA